MPDKDARKIDQDLQDVSAGAAPTPQTGPNDLGSGDGGGGGQMPSWQQPDHIDADNVQAAAAQPKDISGGPEGGSVPGGDSFQPNPIDVDVQAGAAAPQDLGDTAPTPPTPGDPSIRVKVQDADLTGEPGNAAG